MAKYLGLLQLSADEARRVVERGIEDRHVFLELLVREAGGTIEGFWLTDGGDWDVVCIVDMADAPERPERARGAAATLARRAAGLTRREQWIALAEIADVAEAMERLRDRADHVAPQHS